MRISTTWLTFASLSLASSVLAAQPKPSRPIGSAVGAMLRIVLAQLPESTTTACVEVPRGDPDSSLLVALRSASRLVVRLSNCPPTYDVIAVYRDSAGNDVTPRRPPGYVDPYWIRVQEPRLIGTDSAYAVIRVWQGTLNTDFACGARLRDAYWQASCLFIGVGVSRLPPNESLQLASASTSEGLRLSAWRNASASRLVSRIFGRSLAAQLWR